MTQKYRLIKRKNLGADKDSVPTKYYAQAVNNGTVTFDELCEEIAETCTLTSADVKAVMDRINYLLNKNLMGGRIVQFGEVGNFRLALGSSGASSEEEFDTSMIRTPRIVFHPGKKLQLTRQNTSFQKVIPVPADEVEDEEEDDSPDMPEVQ